MAFKIKIVEVNIEEVRQGRNKYDRAAVVYSYNGQNRTQNVMSFSNPAIFAKVRSMVVGQEYNVEVTKNDQGYTQWAAIDLVGADKPTDPKIQTTPARSNVSTYETAQERAIKQLYIVRQSSISHALTYLNNQAKPDYNVRNVLDIAQEFVDFVFNQPSDVLGSETQELLDMGNDI